MKSSSSVAFGVASIGDSSVLSLQNDLGASFSCLPPSLAADTEASGNSRKALKLVPKGPERSGDASG